MSRRARWDQLALSSDDMIRSAAVDFVELYRYGYSTNVIWRAWFQSRGHDAGFGLGLRVLQKLLPRGYKRQAIWHMPEQTLDFLDKILGVNTSTYPHNGLHINLNRRDNTVQVDEPTNNLRRKNNDHSSAATVRKQQDN